jgi:transposase
VYRWFARFRDDGTWERINHHLVMLDRERGGREASPTAAVIDSQSVRTTESGGIRGYDGGKKIKGRKRHAMVDTDGRALKLQVHSAGIQDRDRAGPLLQASRPSWPFVAVGYADGGYAGARVANATPIRIEVVRKCRQSGRLSGHRPALGGRTLLRLDQPKQATGKGLRGDNRERRSVPLRRFQRAPATKARTLSVEKDSKIGALQGAGSGSTRKSSAVPTWWVSSPTTAPSSGSSAR